MGRLTIINSALSTKTNPSYLEIGYGHGEVFMGVLCSDKTCCDPLITQIVAQEGSTNWAIKENFIKDKNCVSKTSDEFFSENKKLFDFIFIDGQHEYAFVKRDFLNAMKFLKEDGCVMLHDCSPPNEWACRPISQFDGLSHWNGDGGYRLIMELYQHSTEYEWLTSTEDQGCCVVKRGTRTAVKLNGSDWNTFNENRVSILNLRPLVHITKQKLEKGWLNSSLIKVNI